jgi:hypothetical protein
MDPNLQVHPDTQARVMDPNPWVHPAPPPLTGFPFFPRNEFSQKGSDGAIMPRASRP